MKKFNASTVDIILTVVTIICGLINTELAQVIFCVWWVFINLHLILSKKTLVKFRKWLFDCEFDLKEGK